MFNGTAVLMTLFYKSFGMFSPIFSHFLPGISQESRLESTSYRVFSLFSQFGRAGAGERVRERERAGRGENENK